jgi:hypothetical protein
MCKLLILRGQGCQICYGYRRALPKIAQITADSSFLATKLAQRCDCQLGNPVRQMVNMIITSHL